MSERPVQWADIKALAEKARKHREELGARLRGYGFEEKPSDTVGNDGTYFKLPLGECVLACVGSSAPSLQEGSGPLGMYIRNEVRLDDGTWLTATVWAMTPSENRALTATFMQALTNGFIWMDLFDIAIVVTPPLRKEE